MHTKRYIIRRISDNYTFFHDVTDELDEDLEGYKTSNNYEVIGVVDADYDVIMEHVCKQSVLYDDMTNYTDTVQNEEKLDENGVYVVTYFKDDNDGGLNQYADYAITKNEIIDNVNAQKYTEGAMYYPLNKLQKVA